MNQTSPTTPNTGTNSLHNTNSNTLDSLKTRLINLLQLRDENRKNNIEKITREKQRQQHLIRENQRLMRELQSLRTNTTSTKKFEENVKNTNFDECSTISSSNSHFKIPITSLVQQDDMSQIPQSVTLIPGAPREKNLVNKQHHKSHGKQLRLKKHFAPTTRQDFTIAHGDLCQEKKDDNTIRMIMLNPGGLTGDEGGKFLDLATQFKNYNTDILFAPESKINPRSDFARNCRALFEERYVKNGIMTVTNTKLPTTSHSAVQAGGVATFISPLLARKHNCTEYDKYGRWHSHTFFFKDKLFKAYCVYRVCGDSNLCENNAYKHQQFQLNLDKIEICPRRQVIIDLKKQLEKDLQRGIDIGVFADANESRTHPTKHFICMMKDLGFHDLLVERMGSVLPPTQNRSKEAIDRIWLTPGIRKKVTKVGILPKDKFLESDHCAIFLELCKTSTLSDETPPLPSHMRRRLKSSDVKACNAYKKLLTKQIEKQGISHRFEKLFRLIDEDASSNIVTTLIESLDQQLFEIRMSCENNLPHQYKEDWTPDLNELLIKRYRLKKKLREIRYNKKNNNTPINMKELGDICDELQDVKASIALRKLDAKTIRKEFNMSLAKEYEKNKKFKTEEIALKVIMNSEESRSTAATIRQVLYPRTKSGLQYIKIPCKEEYPENVINYKDPQTIWNRIEIDQGKDIIEWESITNQKEMEHLLVEFSQLHFKQASTTPLSSVDWINKIDKASSFSDIKSEANNLSPPIHDLLQQLYPLNMKTPSSYSISFDDFNDWIDKKDERTSCSPSGCHYGHFKACKGHIILHYIFHLIKTSLEYDYIPRRWRQTITTLVPKDDEPLIHRLRPIHIIEPEIQFFSNKFWTKDFMFQCEEEDGITDSQYGGRRGRQAQNAVIKQVVMWDVAKLQNKLLASHLADARANFDRNMSHIVRRALISKGFDIKIVHFYQQYLRSQVFRVRTSFGVSSQTYTYDQNDPLFGDGQGIGWSSVNQIIISTIIDEVYCKLASTFHISSVDDCFKILTGVNFFIDDRVSNTINHKNDISSLLQDFQSNETLQTDLLNATGGAVAPKKCNWWLLERKKGDLGFGFIVKRKTPQYLCLQNCGDALPYNIKCLPTDKAKEYLGCWISPSFSARAQFKCLLKVINTWCDRIMCSDLSPKMILKAYKEYLVPKLAYPLVVTDLSWNQANRLMQRIRSTISAKTHYHRGSHLSITHGSIFLFGEELIHIYDLAGREKLAFLTYHIRNAVNQHDTVHDIIMTSFQDHQLWLGNMSNFLNLNYDRWSSIISTRTWLISIWDFLHHYSTHIDIASISSYVMPRENDFYIMDRILDSGETMEDIITFNKVRVHLELLTASDCLLNDGKSSHPDILRGIRPFSRNSSFTWPNKEDISDDWIIIYRRLYRNHIANFVSKHPLGDWTATSHVSERARSYNTDTIILDGVTYKQTYGPRFKATSIIPALTDTLPSIAVSISGPGKLMYVDSNMTHSTHLPPPTTINNFIKETQWGIFPLTEQDIASLLDKLKHPFIVISDGGNPNDVSYSTYGYVIADLQGNTIYSNGGFVLGMRDDQCSFRAEAFGAYSVISLINYLDTRCTCLSENRRYFCDNEQVTKTKPSRYINPKRRAGSKSNYDIHTELKMEMYKHKFDIQIDYVKSHQDEKKDWKELSQEEKGNVLADEMCHKVHNDIQSNPGAYNLTAISPFLLSQEVSFRNSSHRLVRRGFNEVHVDSRTDELFDYLLYKRDISLSTSDLIAWDSLRALAKSLQHFERRKFQKILYRKWLTMEQLHLMNKVDHPTCPVCHVQEENYHHVFICTDAKAINARLIARTQFATDMINAKTPLSIVTLLNKALITNSFCPTLVRQAQSALPSVRDDIATAVLDQTIIGVELLQSGLIAQSWIRVFAGLRYDDSSYKRYPASWMRKFTLALLTYSHTLWRFRCRVLHEQECVTLAKYRRTMKHKFNLLIQDPLQLGKFRNLLKRRLTFFDLASASNLKAWEKKVNIALEKNKKYKPYLPPPITDFFTRLPTTQPQSHIPRTPYRSSYTIRKQRNKLRAQAIRLTTPITNFVRRTNSTYSLRTKIPSSTRYAENDDSASEISSPSSIPTSKPPRPPKPRRRLLSTPTFITQFFKSYTNNNI